MILLTIALLFAQDALEGTAWLNRGVRVTNSPTVQVQVHLNSPAPAGLEMSISDGAWRPYVESLPLELPAGDGAKTVVVRFRDAAGKDRGVLKALIVLDTTPPEAKVRVPDGTAAGRVTLTSDVPDAVAMQWTEDATRWGLWVPYLQPREIALSPGDGIKTILVRYRDEAGNVSKPAALRVESKVDPAATMPPLGQVGVTSAGYPIDPMALTLEISFSGMTAMSVRVDEGPPLPREPFAAKKTLQIPRTEGAHRIRLVLFDAAGAEHPVELAFHEVDVLPTPAELVQEAPVRTPWAVSLQGGLLPSAIDFQAMTPTGSRKINSDALGLMRLSLSRDFSEPLYAQVGLEFAGGGGIRVYSGTLDLGARLFRAGPVDVAAEAGLIYSELKVTESAFGDFDAGLGFRAGVRVSVGLGSRASLDATIDYRRISYDYAEPIVSGDRQARLQTVGLLLGASLKF
jgi:hypothetical protein